jgi:hypothetical protein
MPREDKHNKGEATGELGLDDKRVNGRRKERLL